MFFLLMTSRKASQKATRLLRKIATITRSDFVDAFVAICLLFGFSLAVKFLPFRYLRAWHGRHNACPATRKPPSDQRVAATIRSVRRANRVVGFSACLSQALTGQTLLRRMGVPTRLWVGVNPNLDGAFAAHAWLEWNGQTVLGDQVQSAFTPLFHLDVTQSLT